MTPDGVVGMALRGGEWCSDFYGVCYLKHDVIDPQGPTKEDLLDKSLNRLGEEYHVFRGCGIYTIDRGFGDRVHGLGGYDYGLRIVVELPGKTEVDK